MSEMTDSETTSSTLHSKNTKNSSSISADDLKNKNMNFFRKIISVRNLFISNLFFQLLFISATIFAASWTIYMIIFHYLRVKKTDIKIDQLKKTLNTQFFHSTTVNIFTGNFLYHSFGTLENMSQNSTQQEIALEMMLSQLYSQKDLLSSLNIILKDGSLFAWEHLPDSSDPTKEIWTKYTCSSLNNYHALIENFRIDSKYHLTHPIPLSNFSIPNFNATLIIPTYKECSKIKKQNEAKYFNFSPHIMTKEPVTSSCIPFYNIRKGFNYKNFINPIDVLSYSNVGESELLGTLNTVYFADRIKPRLLNFVEGTQIITGFIQGEGVIIFDSLQNSTSVPSGYCNTNNTLLKTFCEQVSGLSPNKLWSGLGDRTDFTGISGGKSYQAHVIRVYKNVDNWFGLIIEPTESYFFVFLANSWISLVLTIISMIAVMFITTYIVFNLIATLNNISNSFKQLQRFEFSSKAIKETLKKRSIVTENMQLQKNFKSMLLTIKSFSKFVPFGVLRNVVFSDTIASLGLESQNASVMFLDIKDFTTISEILTPSDLVILMGEAFEIISDCIIARNGEIDKYIGDCVMAFWNCPEKVPNHELLACLAALDAIKAVTAKNVQWKKKNYPPIRCRVGINSGVLLAGNIGSEKRIAYTVIGKAVTLADSLEAFNKKYGTTIMVSDSTVSTIMDQNFYQDIIQTNTEDIDDGSDFDDNDIDQNQLDQINDEDKELDQLYQKKNKGKEKENENKKENRKEIKMEMEKIDLNLGEKNKNEFEFNQQEQYNEIPQNDEGEPFSDRSLDDLSEYEENEKEATELLLRRVERVRYSDDHPSILIYELICQKRESTHFLLNNVECYEEAFDLYEIGEFQKAKKMFKKLLSDSKTKEDKCLLKKIEQCDELSKNPPKYEGKRFYVNL